MTRRIDRHADILSRRLERASVVLPDIRDHIAEQRDSVRIIGSATADPGRQSGTHSDPAARAVAERDHWDCLDGYIDIQLGVIEAALNILDTHCRDVLGRRHTDDDDPDKPRCIGDNTAEGEDCWRVPAPRRNAAGMQIDDGRCITCGHRYDARKRAEADARRFRRHINKLGEAS